MNDPIVDDPRKPVEKIKMSDNNISSKNQKYL